MRPQHLKNKSVKIEHYYCSECYTKPNMTNNVCSRCGSNKLIRLSKINVDQRLKTMLRNKKLNRIL